MWQQRNARSLTPCRGFFAARRGRDPADLLPINGPAALTTVLEQAAPPRVGPDRCVDGVGLAAHPAGQCHRGPSRRRPWPVTARPASTTRCCAALRPGVPSAERVVRAGHPVMMTARRM